MTVELTAIDERILAKLGELAERFGELEAQMNDPVVASNPTESTRLAREHSKLAPLVKCYRECRQFQQQEQDAQEMLEDGATDAEMRELAEEEVLSLGIQCQEAMARAKEFLVMSDDVTVGAVIMEIRAGTGGDEASLFARDLYEMYMRYAEKRGWKVEKMSFSATDMGGFREAIFSVKGEGAWGALGYEGGGHRVQRVPETEAQGRIHTSAATVAVLPEPEALEIDIKPDEVEEHVARSSGPGGQSVNKTSSAIKLEHLPTGITVSMQDEKSQHKNRAKAWRVLRSRVYDHFERQKRAQRDATRKDMIGSGDRSQRIRTYNFPQNRMTDHRINVSLYSLDRIMMGDLDELVRALIDYDKQQRLENL
jgi:peptide chain release factor 1